jgi:hypothetical protein
MTMLNTPKATKPQWLVTRAKAMLHVSARAERQDDDVHLNLRIMNG